MSKLFYFKELKKWLPKPKKAKKLLTTLFINVIYIIIPIINTMLANIIINFFLFFLTIL